MPYSSIPGQGLPESLDGLEHQIYSGQSVSTRFTADSLESPV